MALDQVNMRWRNRKSNKHDKGLELIGMRSKRGLARIWLSMSSKILGSLKQGVLPKIIHSLTQ